MSGSTLCYVHKMPRLFFASGRKYVKQLRSESNRLVDSRVFLSFALAITITISALNSTTLTEESILRPNDKFSGTAMYPALKYYVKGELRVSGLHTITYSCYGNPKGKPVLLLHGGPGGGGCNPDMARFFDPTAYRIVLLDQRGCGESVPFGELHENTTEDLILDLEKLRVHLNIDKWQLFGGSWGSTLSLAYAMAYPDRVSELVLRGVFTCRQREVDWFYGGGQGGVNNLFPEDWAAFEGAVPETERDDLLSAYGRRLSGALGESEMHRAALAMSTFGSRTGRLHQAPQTAGAKGEQQQRTERDKALCLSSCRLLHHYTVNRCFLPREGYLLESSNLAKISHIPTVIVQGRYDVMCPAVTAYQLHRSLPLSQLVVTVAGHSATEPENIQELVRATEKFKATQ